MDIALKIVGCLILAVIILAVLAAAVQIVIYAAAFCLVIGLVYLVAKLFQPIKKKPPE